MTGLRSEQVRIVADEFIVLNDVTGYAENATGWITKVAKSVTLTKAMQIYCKGTFVMGATGHGAGRITVDGVPIRSTGGLGHAATSTIDFYIHLAAGTYTVNFDVACWVANITLTLAYIGELHLADAGANAYASGTVSCGPTATTTVLAAQTVTVPPARQTPLGLVKQYAVFIRVVAETLDGASYRNDHMRNVGDGDDANKLNWKLQIDGVQASWASRNNDDADADVTNPLVGSGSWGSYGAVKGAGATFTVGVTCYNGSAGALNARCFVQVLVCPWLLPWGSATIEPVALDVPQFSTIYVVMEAGDLNPTKNFYLGIQRYVDFGDANNYYYTISGIGILSCTYTFEMVEVTSIPMYVKGTGAIISILAVDAR